MLGYAEAILAGRDGDRQRATEAAMAADGELVHFAVWADLARLCAAEPALADGWGQPESWLEAAARCFAAQGIDPLAERCRRLLAGPRPSRWTGLGITAREADVLRLVAEGLANKQIARTLGIAERTVKAHLTSVFTQIGVTDRTSAALWAPPERWRASCRRARPHTRRAPTPSHPREPFWPSRRTVQFNEWCSPAA